MHWLDDWERKAEKGLYVLSITFFCESGIIYKYE
jgi:hypothetical protein